MVSARASATMLATRALVKALAMSGDPAARLLGRRAVPDPFPLYARIRSRGPLWRHPLGVYLTADHATTRTILRDQRFRVGRAADNTGIDWNVYPGDDKLLVHPTEQSLLTMNEPRHAALRRAVAPWFTPQALRTRADRFAGIVEEILDRLAGRTEIDLVRDFALRVPMRIITDLFGLPDDAGVRFAGWGAILSSTLDGIRTPAERRQVRAVLVDMTAFFTDLIDRRRAAPGSDLVSMLLEARPDGRPLAQSDLIALAGMLLIGGFETTANAIASGVLDLIRHPAQLAAWRDDPSLGPQVAEEILRYETPAQFAIRFTTEPVEAGGRTVPVGRAVVLLLAGANRDPGVFRDPDRFDISRPNSRDHLAFAAGSHFCLGAGLARMELELALRRFLARFPEAIEAGPVRPRTGRNIRGPIEASVRLGRSEIREASA